MPELAEVYTVKEALKTKILKKKIQEIKILYKNIVEDNEKDFTSKLIGQSFIDIKQKAKYLVFETEDYYLISHLRMEGKFFVKDINDEIAKHEHVIFNMEGGLSLRYHDTRKFGRMKLINKNEYDDYFKDIGPDANDDINDEYLYTKIKGKNLPIKALLLDQSIISGLGNIYTDEVLYASNLLPTKPGKELSLEDCHHILQSSKEILNSAIKHKGTTIRSYTSSLGVFGTHQDYLLIHTKIKCPKGHEVKKCKVAGRTSYYCDICQK